MQQSIIGLKDLRENMDNYINQIEKGKSFIVARKSKPVFTISPANEDESLWEEVIDFTKIKKGGVAIENVLKALRSIDG